MITTSRRLARWRKGMPASRSPRRESGAVLSILLIGLSPILLPLAIVLVAAPVAWIGEQIWPPKERQPVCVERSVDDGDRPAPPPPLKCDPAPGGGGRKVGVSLRELARGQPMDELEER